jgi:hypothetical protein
VSCCDEGMSAFGVPRSFCDRWSFPIWSVGEGCVETWVPRGLGRRARASSHWARNRGLRKPSAGPAAKAMAEIAGNFGDNPTQIESARSRLADAVISVTTEGCTDVAALKNGALQVMALDYRSGIRPLAPKVSR